MRECPSCGSGNQDDARFCASCGMALFEPCPSCGSPLPDAARFCPSCGYALRETAPVEERKLVTVLFNDLADSTALGEVLDPERLKDVMNTYFEAMREEIEAEGGSVEKFIGDAIMAAFGVPAAHEDDAARALRAALRMRRRLEALNERLRREHGISLAMRSGVNSGYVVAVPDARPGEAMVTGDAVNVAARLQGAASPGEVFVAERVARAAPGFEFEPVGPLELRGKREPVGAVRLVGESSLAERGVPGLSAPMIGRDNEMDLMRSVFDRVAREGRPHLVTVYGDPGVGKSRLVREFAEAVESSASAPLVVRGRCLPYGQGVTYWPLAEILKALGGVLDTDPPESALEKVRKLARDVLRPEVSAAPERSASALALSVGLNDPESELSRLEAEQIRAEMHLAWRSFFSGVAEDRPVVAVVEDIHWADPALLDLLDDVAAHATGPLLLVCPSRPELTDGRPSWGGGRRNFSSIFLEPLTSNDADRLIRFLLEIEDLPPALRERIVSKAEGNPFFLEEIVRRLIDEGALVRSDGRWRSADTILDIEVPDTIQAVLAARIDLLGREEKRTLQMAAVVGRVFWIGPVARLLGRDPSSLHEVFAGLEERELVAARLGSTMAGDRELIFKHILTRDVAYESLPRRERAAVHAEVARWIEDFAGERRSEFSELLAHHWLEAYRSAREAGAAEEGLREHAFETLLAAAGDARRKVALKRARGFAEEALALASSPEDGARALEVHGRIVWDQAEGDVAWRSLRDAFETRLESVPGDRQAIARVAAHAADVPTRSPGSMKDRPRESDVATLIEIGLEHAGDGDSVERARLLTAKAFWPFAYPEGVHGEADLDRFEAAAEEAAAMALRLGRPALAAAALDGVASRYGGRGLYGRGLGVMRRRLDLVDRISDAVEIADIYSVASWHEFHIGRYRRGVEFALEGLRRVTGRAPSWELHLLAWLVVNRCRQGAWDEMEADVARAQDLLGDRARRPPGYAMRLHGAAAWMHDVRGETARADDYLSILDESAPAEAARSYVGTRYYGAVGWVASLLVRRGDLARARQILDDEDAAPFDVHQSLVFEARCDLVVAAEDWDAAPAVVARAREFADEAQIDVLRAFADRLQGRAAIAAGSGDVAIEALSRASETFGRLEARWERAATDLSLAEAFAASGDASRAKQALAGATSVFEELRSARELEVARDLVARLG